MELTAYSVALRMLITLKRKLNIVVIGANDGRINDPVYDFAKRMSRKTRVLLVEPNKSILPYLQENYSSHPSCHIANCAIGNDGTLALYTIGTDWWSHFQPAYAKGWPPYRAATGITSANRAHVERALAREGLDPDDVIEIIEVPSKELKTLLTELNWLFPIDVLQIDAEGYDDSVIFASSLAHTRPKIIWFESGHIPQARMSSLLEYLSINHYRTYKFGVNSLSVSSQGNPFSIPLNIILPTGRSLRTLARKVKDRFRKR